MEYNKLSKKEKDKYVIEATDNQYVADLDVKTMRLMYSKDFYIVMYKKISEGMTYVQAYESLGFDTSKLGIDRANSAGKRAKILGEQKGFLINASNYDGSITQSEMGDMTIEEELAYLKARNIYLENVIEVQKKTPLILEELQSSLKKN